MTLQCYFHMTTCQNTAAHQKHTPAQGVISPGYVLSLQIQNMCSADSLLGAFPRVSRS